jgi:nucleotide-binding universal stress UspA family protein
MLPIRTILHPTDFSPCSAEAFQVACSLARDYGARLFLLHVQPPVVITGEWGLPPPEPADVRKTLQEQLGQLRPPDPKISVEHHLKEGEAVAEILRLAQESHCDLIVIGTHGWTGLNRLLMGSVAEEVVRKAPCPVLTVRIPLPAASPVSSAHQEPATRR